MTGSSKPSRRRPRPSRHHIVPEWNPLFDDEGYCRIIAQITIHVLQHRAAQRRANLAAELPPEHKEDGSHE